MKREERGTPANRDESPLGDFYRVAFDGTDWAGDSNLAPGIPASIEVGNLEASLSRIWDCGGTIVSVLVASTGAPMSATIRDPAGNHVMVVTAG